MRVTALNEIRNGVGTRGQEIYVVQALSAEGYANGSHHFDTKAEALAWCKAQVAPFTDFSI